MKALFPSILTLLAIAMPAAAVASTRTDLRDYALASCLAKQKASPTLQTEGYRLADIVLARAGVSPLDWKALDAAVGAAFVRRGMLMVHVDGPVAQATQPAPLASCLLAIESAPVRGVMQKLAGTGKR